MRTTAWARSWRRVRSVTAWARTPGPDRETTTAVDFWTMTTDATRIYRALLIDVKTGVSWDRWIRLTSRADDGRDPCSKDATGPSRDHE